MANANRTNKDRVVLSAGQTLTSQSSNPIATSDYGLWLDSNNEPNFSAAGTTFGMARTAGIIPSARLILSAQPANNDTIAIGGTTFKFLTSLTTAGAFVQVKIGADAAATLASLVKAINGTAAAAEWTESTTPFAKTVLADAVSTSLRIRWADARGGNAIAGTSGSVALTESITDAADIWNAANLNVSGKAATDTQFTAGSFAVTAQMLTAAGYLVELPFTPTAFGFTCTSSTGVLRSITDALTISGNGINVAMAGGASPAIQSGDVIRFWAIA